ncbi:galactoside alpha-(1,2)-fucosyltransferase 2-like isoform X2 [Paramacrobiotus metropolitanus]|nr:galactoside alpha-(1,2)-fucosyltransferase 2-like isoform X2 [Paramacrobiotus metropolitanus]XP_055352744.1 galactoside alpha-(1,2)-fucosyltransferase 2-like isoform X2 [Paramacrobiotus metropolitanus]XP_055352745.1 galactoside alpha-(1,2)-fucosyltransferase 2-like isoform X2 [Paramacrobiotus metropolitanus]
MAGRIEVAKKYRIQQHKLFHTVNNNMLNGSSLRRFLTYQPVDGGLGNFMFQSAMLVGCARKNDRIPVRITHDSRLELFEGMDIGFLNRSVLFPNNSRKAQTLGELGPGKFSPDFHNVSSRFPDQAASLSGYGQSWKYFHDASHEIRALLTFKETIQQEAINAILDGLSNLSRRGVLLNRMQPVHVGIHVRRGDIVSDADQVAHGHVAATEEYLLRMALRIQRRYPYAVFFVISNDLDYCRRLFREPNFIFVDGNAAEVDMAIMTFMDVMVMSVGSYSWWSSYLSDAQEVFYFKDWPRNGSDFAEGVAAEDYFFPAWHGDN